MTDLVAADCGIRQLHARCIDATWRKDAKAFAECFTEDGEWKIAGLHLRGQAEIEATFAKLLGLCEKVFTHYGTPILELGAGEATGRTYVFEHAKLASGQNAHTIGIYYEWFAEQPDGTWRFKRRHWGLQYRGPVDLSAPFYDAPDYGPPPGMPGLDEPTTVKRPE